MPLKYSSLEHKYGKVGDSEYIYVFERIAYPIIKKFNPELIFVSAGFDSGRGDPLGGLDLTQDGYVYMLRKLQLVQPRIIMGLEGGYNLETISRASEACVRVLLGEQLPLSCADRKLSLEELRETATPNVTAELLLEKSLKTFEKYWPEILDSKDLIGYEKLIAENVRYNVLYRHTGPKLFRLVGDRYLLTLEKQEAAFFEQVSKVDEASPKELQNLKKWIVKYYGKEVLDGKEYLAFEKYLPKSLKDSQVVMIQVYPPEKTNSLNASITLEAKFDSTCPGEVSTKEKKISYADLATLKKMKNLKYDPFDWKQFSENHQPPEESFKDYEKIVECVRAAELVLEKDSKTKSLTILVIKNGISVLDVKVTSGMRSFTE